MQTYCLLCICIFSLFLYENMVSKSTVVHFLSSWFFLSDFSSLFDCDEPWLFLELLGYDGASLIQLSSSSLRKSYQDFKASAGSRFYLLVLVNSALFTSFTFWALERFVSKFGFCGLSNSASLFPTKAALRSASSFAIRLLFSSDRAYASSRARFFSSDRAFASSRAFSFSSRASPYLYTWN